MIQAPKDPKSQPPEKRASLVSELSYQTLRENVVSAIRTKILNQELAPGTRIVEQSLSREFGISRGPIREALRQLEQEGLVEYTRNAGCSVKAITLEDIYEIYLLRSHYEILAVRLCNGIFSPTEIEKMEKILADMKTLQSGEFGRLVACDHMFHQIIIQKPGLPRLLKAWKELDYGSYIIGSNSDSNKTVFAEHQYANHRRLMDFLLTKDTEIICRAIFDHYMLPMKKTMEKRGSLPDNFQL